MKGLISTILCLVFTIALAGTAHAGLVIGPEVMVYCIGTESGGDGGPLGSTYCYEVSVSVADSTISAFGVGWHGGQYPGIYAVFSDGSGIPGWTGTPNSPGQEQDYDGKTPHGQYSPGPSGNCPAITLWQGSALGVRQRNTRGQVPHQDCSRHRHSR